MEKALATDLGAIRLCVELGFVTPATVAAWADSVVETEASPSATYCELALVAHKRDAEILEILEAHRDAALDPETWEKVLAWVAKRIRDGDLGIAPAVRRIWALASATRPSEELYLAFSVLEDEYACARDGIYGSLPQIRVDLLEALDRFGRPGGLTKVAV